MMVMSCHKAIMVITGRALCFHDLHFLHVNVNHKTLVVFTCQMLNQYSNTIFEFIYGKGNGNIASWTSTLLRRKSQTLGTFMFSQKNCSSVTGTVKSNKSNFSPLKSKSYFLPQFLVSHRSDSIAEAKSSC